MTIMPLERRENCKLHEAQIEEMSNNIKELKKIMLGNGVIGIAEMARRSFEYMQHCKNTKNGLLDWTFRAVITVMIGYIAIKIGLR